MESIKSVLIFLQTILVLYFAIRYYLLRLQLDRVNKLIGEQYDERRISSI